MDISRDELATAAGLATLGAFQVALAAGVPWGGAAYGGTHPGTLPYRLRTVSGAAAVGYGTGVLLIVRGAGAARVRSRAFTTLSAAMGIGAVANAASPSPVERAVWTPVTAATAVLAWRARGASSSPLSTSSVDHDTAATHRKAHGSRHVQRSP